MLRVPCYGLQVVSYGNSEVGMRNVEYYVNQTFSKFHFRIPHSQFRIQEPLFSDFCHLLVCIGCQIDKHLFKVGIGYIGRSLKIGGSAAGDQLPLVDDTDTLTDILGHCQCMC